MLRSEQFCDYCHVYDIHDLRVKQFLFALVCWTIEYSSWDRGGRAVAYVGEGLRGLRSYQLQCKATSSS